MARLKRLAVVWQVSQAEVVSRSVAQADASTVTKEDRASALRTLHRAGDTLVWPFTEFGLCLFGEP